MIIHYPHIICNPRVSVPPSALQPERKTFVFVYDMARNWSHKHNGISRSPFVGGAFPRASACKRTKLSLWGCCWVGLRSIRARINGPGLDSRDTINHTNRHRTRTWTDKWTEPDFDTLMEAGEVEMVEDFENGFFKSISFFSGLQASKFFKIPSILSIICNLLTFSSFQVSLFYKLKLPSCSILQAYRALKLQASF